MLPKIKNETKLSILILLWILDKAIMLLLFWAIKQAGMLPINLDGYSAFAHSDTNVPAYKYNQEILCQMTG